MKTSSAKAKGRRLQKRVADDLLSIGKDYGLERDDVKPVSMGVSGVDVLLSPAARRLFDLLIECKNHEKLNVVGVFNDHLKKYADKPGLKLLVHSRNRSQDMVTMLWADFVQILSSNLLEGALFQFSRSSTNVRSKTKGGTNGRHEHEGASEEVADRVEGI